MLNYDCDVIGMTSNLANRPLLKEDIAKYIDKADVLLTELKAAAIDVATKVGMEAGLDIIYCDNIPIPIDYTYPDLSKSIINLIDSAIFDFNNEIND